MRVTKMGEEIRVTREPNDWLSEKNTGLMNGALRFRFNHLYLVTFTSSALHSIAYFPCTARLVSFQP